MKLEINNLSKTLDNNIILDNINMSLESGNIYGFIGRNGSGKTMLLKVICGFVKPTSGTILINDENALANNYFNNEIRALIEKPNFINNLSGFDNLKLLASINNKIDDKTILTWLDKVDLLEEKDKLYSKYSLGMKQKLGIVQALMEDTKIILLDEPLNGIDENSVNIIRNILLEEKNKDKLIIIATHIKEDIEKLCNIIYHFDSGKVTIVDKKTN